MANVTSELQLKLERVTREAEKIRDSRMVEISNEHKPLSTELIASMDQIPIKDSDKVSYVYSVQPQLTTLRSLIEAGMPSTQIADVLQVSHNSLMRMKEHIPAVQEVFRLAQLTKVELAQESLYKLARQDVIEEQVVDREGRVVTLQKVVQPQFQAVRYILENHMPENYGTKQIVEHTSSEGLDKLNQLLEVATPELLQLAIEKSKAIEAEVVYADESKKSK